MLALSISALILIADQIAKFIFLQYMPNIGDSYHLWPNVLHLTHVRNTGAAMGILNGWQDGIIIVATVAVFVIMAYLFLSKKKLHTLQKVSLGLIVGGALGNLIDRLVYGYVVDFIDFTLIHFYVFNIADSAIVIGTILYACFIIFEGKFKHKANGERDEPQPAG